MDIKLNIKPIDFSFGDYLSQGFEILKKNYTGFLGAFLITILMSIIPFCALLAFGNFYKFCHKTFRGEPAVATEIFNFDDFLPYFYLQLIIFGAVLLFEIPLFLIIFLTRQGSESFSFLIPIYAIMLVIFSIYFFLKGFYMPALISGANVKDLRTAWNMSKTMTKGNGWNILLFAFVISFLSQIGIILCFIGVLLTLPYHYICQFLAYDDAIKQIKYDEIKEVGTV
jgi:hypothetical protein